MSSMSENEKARKSRRQAERGDYDPLERMRKVFDELAPEWEASRERSRRAIAEAEVALKLRSR
jgi:hypothetical protein